MGMLGVLLLIASLPACQRDSKLSQLPDEKILAELRRCDSIKNKSSLKQVLCENHLRECQRRELCPAS